MPQMRLSTLSNTCRVHGAPWSWYGIQRRPFVDSNSPIEEPDTSFDKECVEEHKKCVRIKEKSRKKSKEIFGAQRAGYHRNEKGRVVRGGMVDVKNMLENSPTTGQYFVRQ